MIVKRLYQSSVFYPWWFRIYMAPAQVLALLFHRSAATMYLIYVAWGIAALTLTIPTVEQSGEDPFSDLFKILVVLCSAVACVGATWFTKFARTEMFAASSLVTLHCVYLGFMFYLGINGDEARLVNSILNLSHLVVPTSRVVYIYQTLMRKGAQKNG